MCACKCICNVIYYPNYTDKYYCSLKTLKYEFAQSQERVRLVRITFCNRIVVQLQRLRCRYQYGII